MGYLMMRLLPICGILLNSAVYAESTEWIAISNEHWTADKIKYSSKLELLKDDFSKKSFDQPFLIKTRFSYIAGRPDKLFDFISTKTTMVDCKNMRYADANESTVSYDPDLTNSKNKLVKVSNGKKTYFDLSKSTPDKAWRSSDPESKLIKLVCTPTKGYKLDKVKSNPMQPDWKFKKFTNGPAVYLNNNDLAHSATDKPFIVRQKRFTVLPEKAPNSQLYTSTITYGVVDCKNNKSAVLKNVYLKDDFEYVLNTSPKAAYTQTFYDDIELIPSKSWNELNSQFIGESGLCKE